MDFKQLTNGQSEGFAIIKKCDVKVTAKGSEYLDMKLADSSGEVVARLWDYAPLIHGEYAVDDIVKVRGEITKYNGNDQLSIIKIRKAGPDDDVKPEDYVKSADYSGEYMYSKLISIAEDFEDDELKRLVLKMYSERKDLLLTWPAAFRLHHAVRGGLLMHTLSIVKLCEGVCEVYPFVNRELLITGAMLHDIAKTIEYSVSSVGTATGYTIEGNLIGHLVKGAMLVDRACEELSVSKEKAMLIEHMLISHHSEPEYGAAVRPMFLEAELLSELDNMDARVNQIARAVETLEKDEFSSKLWALNDRKMFNIMEKDKDLRVNLD